MPDDEEANGSAGALDNNPFESISKENGEDANDTNITGVDPDGNVNDARITGLDRDDDSGSTWVDGEGDKDGADTAEMALETTGATADNAYDEMALLDETIVEIKHDRESI